MRMSQTCHEPLRYCEETNIAECRVSPRLRDFGLRVAFVVYGAESSSGNPCSSCRKALFK